MGYTQLMIKLLAKWNQCSILLTLAFYFKRWLTLIISINHNVFLHTVVRISGLEINQVLSFATLNISRAFEIRLIIVLLLGS